MKACGFARLALWTVCLALSAAFTPAAGEDKTLHIYTWSDYFDPDLIHEFESEFGCRVSIDYFDSNEAMYAKLKAGGGGYDLITPSSYMSAVMRGQGMLRDLDHDELPNLDHLDRNFTKLTEDPDLVYSVPYTRTVTGVGYNRKRVSPSDLGSWAIFANVRFSKRMTMLNDMRETIGAALKFRGYSLNTVNAAEIEAAGDTLVEWKKNLAKFDVDEAKIGLGAGEFSVVHAYNGDVALIMMENQDIGFYIPEEGASLASDDFVIVKDSRSADLAHAFINYMLDPEVARDNMESIRYFMPNPDAVEMLSDDLRSNPAFNVSNTVLGKCEVIRDLGPENAKYVKVWDRVKADE